MAGVTGQRHGNATAAQQESNLLAAGILLDDTKGEQTEKTVRNDKKKCIPFRAFYL